MKTLPLAAAPGAHRSTSSTSSPVGQLLDIVLEPAIPVGVLKGVERIRDQRPAPAGAKHLQQTAPVRPARKDYRYGAPM
jgi:hypothetical protein